MSSIFNDMSAMTSHLNKRLYIYYTTLNKIIYTIFYHYQLFLKTEPFKKKEDTHNVSSLK